MRFWRELAADKGSGGVLGLVLAVLLVLAGIAPSAAHSADGVVLCQVPSPDPGTTDGPQKGSDPLCLSCVVCTGPAAVSSANTPEPAAPDGPVATVAPWPAEAARPGPRTLGRYARGPPVLSV